MPFTTILTSAQLRAAALAIEEKGANMDDEDYEAMEALSTYMLTEATGPHPEHAISITGFTQAE